MASEPVTEVAAVVAPPVPATEWAEREPKARAAIQEPGWRTANGNSDSCRACPCAANSCAREREGALGQVRFPLSCRAACPAPAGAIADRRHGRRHPGEVQEAHVQTSRLWTEGLGAACRRSEPNIKEAVHVAKGSPQTAAEAMAAAVADDLGMEYVRARIGRGLETSVGRVRKHIVGLWKPGSSGHWASADVVSRRREQEHGLLGHDIPRLARDR